MECLVNAVSVCVVMPETMNLHVCTCITTKMWVWQVHKLVDELFVCVCVCVCVDIYMTNHIYIYIYISAWIRTMLAWQGDKILGELERNHLCVWNVWKLLTKVRVCGRWMTLWMSLSAPAHRFTNYRYYLCVCVCVCVCVYEYVDKSFDRMINAYIHIL